MAILKAMDCSSYQPRNLTNLIATHKPQHVIPKLYLPIENVSQEHSRAQIRSARENGCTVGGYVWCYGTADPYATIDSVITLCASVELVLPLLWLDCETYADDPGPNADWLSRAVDQAERVYGMKCGIYTGLWWINGHFPGGQAEFSNFARLPIWLSDYDSNPDINDVTLPQGWTEAAAKQYTSTPVDLNSIREEYTVYSVEQPDPCAEIQAKYDKLKADLAALLEGA